MRTFQKLLLLLLLPLFLAVSAPAAAQCAMCRATLETNLKNGGTAGKGMNRGIFLILGLPYILVGGIGFVWYRNRKLENND